MPINQWYTKAACFLLNITSHQNATFISFGTVHMLETQQAVWPLPDNWWKGLAMYSSARSCRKSYIAHNKFALYPLLIAL